MTRALSRETAIGLAALGLALAAMAVDHLLGDDPGLEDPPTFLISAGLSLALALVLFGGVVPRAKAGAAPDDRAAKRGLACSVLAVVALPLTLWLGLPFVLGGAGIALGLLGHGGRRRRLALAAIVLGTLVLLAGTVGYTVVAIDKLA